MDVNPIKPIPVVQKARKVEHERKGSERNHERSPSDNVEQDETDDGSKRIDTYA